MNNLMRILGIGTAFGLGCLSSSLQPLVSENKSAPASVRTQLVNYELQEKNRDEEKLNMKIEMKEFQDIEQTRDYLAHLNNQIETIAKNTMREYDANRKEEDELVLSVETRCKDAVIKFQEKAGIKLECEYAWYAIPNRPNYAISQTSADLMNELGQIWLRWDYQFNPNKEQ